MKHFRLAKGWKKEIEEVSLTLLVAVLFFNVLSLNANLNAASGTVGLKTSARIIGGQAAKSLKCIPFLGKITTVEVCVLTPSGIEPKPCKVVGDFLIGFVGFPPIPQFELPFAVVKQSKAYPAPGFYAGGGFIPGYPSMIASFFSSK